jgi:hypothetical protein
MKELSSYHFFLNAGHQELGSNRDASLFRTRIFSVFNSVQAVEGLPQENTRNTYRPWGTPWGDVGDGPTHAKKPPEGGFDLCFSIACGKFLELICSNCSDRSWAFLVVLFTCVSQIRAVPQVKSIMSASRVSHAWFWTQSSCSETLCG